MSIPTQSLYLGYDPEATRSAVIWLCEELEGRVGKLFEQPQYEHKLKGAANGNSREATGGRGACYD